MTNETTPRKRPRSDRWIDTPLPTLAGRVLGSYRLLHRLGEGAMGVVYLGEHLRLNRMVAIKVLRRELTVHKELIVRFFNEARAVNNIGHPNIVDIVDFVEKFDEDPPIVYMVLEYLEGRDLSAALEADGPLSVADTIKIGLQIASALVDIHAARILHRDLKPENIFLVQGDTDRVKLLDFGIAKDFGADEEAITAPDLTIGTPEFMAPEQIQHNRIDPRVDIYSLGLLLHCMLTGKPPFSSPNLGVLLNLQIKEKPPDIGQRRGADDPVPPALEETIMCCLEKDPDRRFQTAGELRQALTDCAGHPGRSRIARRRRGAGGMHWTSLLPLIGLAILAAAITAYFITS